MCSCAVSNIVLYPLPDLFSQSVMPTAPAGRRRCKGVCSGLGVSTKRTLRKAKVMNILSRNSPRTLQKLLEIEYMGTHVVFFTANTTAATTTLNSVGVQLSSGDEEGNA